MGFFGDALNFGLGVEKMKYERRMQEETWNREDTAVQRRMEDLRAAGLSPTLAAGSAAQTSSPIDVALPNWGGTAGDKAAALIGMARQKADISRTFADTKVAETQAEANRVATDLNRENIKTAAVLRAKADADRRAAEFEVLRRQHDYNIYKDSPNKSDVNNQAEQWANMLNAILKVIKPGAMPYGATFLETADRAVSAMPAPKAPGKKFGFKGVVPGMYYDGPKSGTDMHNRAQTRPR